MMPCSFSADGGSTWASWGNGEDRSTQQKHTEPGKSDVPMSKGKDINYKRCFRLLVALLHLPLATSLTTNNRCRPLRVAPLQSSSSKAATRIKLSELDRRHGILYRKSVFSKEEYATIADEIRAYVSSGTLVAETTSSVAMNRLGVALPSKTSDTVEIIKNGSLCQLVQSVVGPDYMVSDDIPVEIRVYEKMGAGMQWHVDDVLYDPPQVEVVWTLENTSDCVTMWKTTASKDVNSVESEPNSVILLKAGESGPPHCVTSLKRGRRVIVKCAFIKRGATALEALTNEQFGPATKKRKKKRR